MLRQDAPNQIHVFRGALSRIRIATVNDGTVEFNGNSSSPFFDHLNGALDQLDQNDHQHNRI
jgi:hypothetical protein